jgi:hypothetical protein
MTVYHKSKSQHVRRLCLSKKQFKKKNNYLIIFYVVVGKVSAMHNCVGISQDEVVEKIKF